MRPSRCRRLFPVLLVVGAVSVARAETPTPLDLGRFYSFPGAVPGAATAVSAGLGLADRWLGEEPFDNPAASPARGVMAAPVFQRVKRQDLPADFRQYSETAGTVDFAGGRLSWPLLGFGVTLYGYEPVLRVEDASFVARPGETPGAFSIMSTQREWRAGLGVSHPWRQVQLGVAVEWTGRDDSYDYTDTSVPILRTRHADFSGGAVGFQAGVRAPVTDRVLVGAALRYLPTLEVDGTQTLDDDSRSVAATRDAGVEGGVSARVTLGETFRAFASLGGATARSWDGFDLTEGSTLGWRVGGEYADPELPLSFRFGLGQEQQQDTPEGRAGVYALGLGWRLSDARLDAGLMRRSISRTGKPTSYDDRAVVGVAVDF